MFRLKSPEILEIIQGSVISSNDKLDKLKNNKIVVISVIGSSTFHEEKGYKRAFRLVLDSFGSPVLFKDRDRSVVRAKVRKKEETSTGTSDSEQSASQGNNNEIKDDREKESSEKDDDNQNYARDCDEIGCIDGFYTEDERILFLHLQGAFDPNSFLREWHEASQKLESKESGFSELWAGIKAKYCRSLLLLFSLSHVMLVSNCGCYFDTSYIHLFRIIDTVRLEVLGFTSKLLSKIDGIPKAWRDHGRMCSPRILFLFQTNTGRPPKVLEEIPVKDPVKDMQYKLEDEIYHIFRKCRIVTNISANSLFAIPSTQEYVFIYDEGVQEPEMCDDPSRRLAHITSRFCEKMSIALSDPALSDYKNSSKLSFASTFPTMYATNASKPICDQLRTYRDVLADFRDFITSHSRLAHESGFDDDSKHVAEHKHFFVMPTFKQWRKAFQTLFTYFVEETHSDFRATDALSTMYQFSNADTDYLESQCAKMFPKVYALYLKNLPEIFPEKLHKAKVAHAIEAFVKVSRGPGVRPWITKLIEKCDRYWKRGHQQCEARSLHEHTCCHPLHRFKVEDHLEVIPLPVMDESLPEMEHSTGLRFLSYCNCGHRQGSRDEPFTICEANFKYYERLAQDCCDRLDRIDFPVFIPPSGHQKSTIHPQEMLLVYQQKLLGLIHHNHLEVPSQDLEDELRQEDSLEFENEEVDAEEEENSERVETNVTEQQPPAKEVAPVEAPPVKLAPPNAWVKAPVLIEQEFLPRTELENEYIYKRIRERKEAEESSKLSILDTQKSEYQAKILKLTQELREDILKGEENRKDIIKGSGFEESFSLLAPNSKNIPLRENFFRNFPLSMKSMALSMRFKPDWEQTSKRLPEQLVAWVNEYVSRRRFLEEDHSWDVDATTLIENFNVSIPDSVLEEQVAAIVDTTYEDDTPPSSATESLPPTSGIEGVDLINESLGSLHITADECFSNHTAITESTSAFTFNESELPVKDSQLLITELPVQESSTTCLLEKPESSGSLDQCNESVQSIDTAYSTSEVTASVAADSCETIVNAAADIPPLPNDLKTGEAIKEDQSKDHSNENDEGTVEIISSRTEDCNKARNNDNDEPSVSAQEDTTMQYLPGMLHSRSLRGLLPLFSSWSLVCVGSSSLYTHSAGITHQPGFLNGSSTLLPWDKMVKAEAGVSKPIPRLIRGRKPTGRAKRITDEFTVKVFVGVEYECKRGHRFLLEGPERILQTQGQHGTPNLKEAALVVIGSDMPLYYRCPCKDSRDGTIMIAQLMRIHVITPKAPVHVVLDPKVQPGPPPCPIFHPGNKEPVKLTPSSYWILRLPYCYVGDDQVYVPSKDVTRYNGRLLKGLLDVESMTPNETKIWEIQNTNVT